MLTLQELLPLIQKKYPEARIDGCRNQFIDGKEVKINKLIIQEEDEEGSELYLEIDEEDSKYPIEWHKHICNHCLFERIDLITLKHYLNIEIEWEDLKEYAKIYDKTDDKEQILFSNGLRFRICGTIKLSLWTIGLERSYWQMYNVIKNLTEN
jgi:hypothetical protein